jgi:hypothetical protein
MTGIEGQTRRLMVTDLDSWHWENLSMPAGVRFAPYEATGSTGQPLAAVAHFGPEGLEGKLSAGHFQEVGDALLSTPNGRNLSLRLQPDGSFRAGSSDVLPTGEFLAATVLSDRQQRRQEVYREFSRRSPADLWAHAGVRGEVRNVLLAWANPIDLHMPLGPEATVAGNALLVVPLRLERGPAVERRTIPGPLLPYRQILEVGSVRPLRESTNDSDLHLRFQLPAVVLPFTVQQARLVLKINAPGRRVTISGYLPAGGLVELYRAENPLDPIRLDVADERVLHVDEDGGLHVNLSMNSVAASTPPGKGDVVRDEKWSIEYLDLEVSGR